MKIIKLQQQYCFDTIYPTKNSIVGYGPMIIIILYSTCGFFKVL